MTEIRTTSSTGGQKGVKLERHDLIPQGPLRELAEHYGVGASKYDDNQWRSGYEWSKSFAAMVRHQTLFWQGYDYDVCSNDPEGCRHTDMDGNPFVAVREDACFNHTGSHHMVAAAWHAFTLLEFKDSHPGHDDRYKPEPKFATFTELMDAIMRTSIITKPEVVWPKPEAVEALEDIVADEPECPTDSLQRAFDRRDHIRLT